MRVELWQAGTCRTRVEMPVRPLAGEIVHMTAAGFDGVVRWRVRDVPGEWHAREPHPSLPEPLEAAFVVEVEPV